jgi:hypothetical protein
MSDFAAAASVQEEVLEFLLSSPTTEQIIGFHASEVAQMRLHTLLEANRQGILTSEERAELEEASQLNHIVMLLKAKANQRTQSE